MGNFLEYAADKSYLHKLVDDLKEGDDAILVVAKSDPDNPDMQITSYGMVGVDRKKDLLYLVRSMSNYVNDVCFG